MGSFTLFLRESNIARITFRIISSSTTTTIIISIITFYSCYYYYIAGNKVSTYWGLGPVRRPNICQESA